MIAGFNSRFAAWILVDEMEEIVKQALLFDFYGELLTLHQQDVYKAIVFEDLSLSEVAEQFGISRQGVFDLIKRCNRQLAGYEQKLHLVEKFDNARRQVEQLRELIAEAGRQNQDARLIEAQEKIHSLLETF